MTSIRPLPGRPGTYRHDGLHCPSCGKYLDAATNTEQGGRAAEDGDYAVCVGCGVMSIFVIGPLGVAFRAPDADELTQFMAAHGSVILDPRAYLP